VLDDRIIDEYDFLFCVICCLKKNKKKIHVCTFKNVCSCRVCVGGCVCGCDEMCVSVCVYVCDFVFENVNGMGRESEVYACVCQ
jgi:hypothetical protein